MFTLVAILAILSSAGLTAWLTLSFSNPSSRFYIVDNPNERSLHSNPTPRSGGLAILVGLLGGAGLSALAGDYMSLLWILVALVPVAGVSYLDDRREVPVLLRLMMHMIGAVIFVWGGGFAFQNLPFVFDNIWYPWLGMAAAILYVMWMINLYNFMDGMDGLAAGMAVFGFSCFAIMGWISGNLMFTQCNLIIVGTSLGFLFFNFPPARIFMGDVGSSTLGLLAAALSLWGVRDNVFPFWIVVLVFSVFILDASITLIRRLFQREIVWKAHKTHFYQKLAESGWGHQKTLLVLYAIMAACSVTAVFSMYVTDLTKFFVITSWVIFYTIFFSWASWYTIKRI